MTHKDIISLQKNKYSFNEFLVLCADNGIDACDTNQWGNTLSSYLFHENFKDNNHETTFVGSTGNCCGGGKVV